MADGAIRAPRSLTEAQRLCEKWAQLDGEIAAIEEAREVAIAAANAEVDKDLLPLVARRDAIAAKLGPWWGENSALLTQGKRKSAELGGCVLATSSGRASVVLTKPETDVIKALQRSPSAVFYLRTTTALIRPSISVGLSNGGAEAEELAAAGLSLERGPDVFSIKRTGQAGTQGKVQR